MTDTVTKLYARSQDDLTLIEAVKSCTSIIQDAVALLYSPTFCRFLKVNADGDFTDSNGAIFNVQSVFEARIFNSDHELRWLNQKGGKGKAVLLSEQTISNFGNPIPEISALDVLKQEYLLWGQGVSDYGNGWSKLSEARIGTLDVPLGGVNNKKMRAKLIAKEYIGLCEGKAGEYGNVAVLEERLIKLEVES